MSTKVAKPALTSAALAKMDEEETNRNRKSTFTKRQKFFVRNFLEDQFSANQYYLFPGNKNPLNKNSPTELVRSHTFTERGPARTYTARRNQTVTANPRGKSNQNLSTNK